MSSTTFDSQLDVASRVAADNPHLYFEIQSLNAFGEEPLVALSAAVERLLRTVRERDAEGFVALMQRGHEYLQGRRAALEAGG